MDVALLSMAMSQSQIQQQVSISVLKQAMDQAEVNANFINSMIGEADVQALQHAAQPHLGGTIDIKG